MAEHGMTREEAEALADLVRGAVDDPVAVKRADGWFEVVVTTKLGTFFLVDEDDWDRAGPRVRRGLDARFETEEGGAIVVLYRPVGQAELDLIRDADWRAFPPRLDWQPIFYPVLNREYASMIAERWNVKDRASGNVGYVLGFRVGSATASKYDVQVVGSAICRELWVPAEELVAFNRAIVGPVEVIAEYRPDGGASQPDG